MEEEIIEYLKEKGNFVMWNNVISELNIPEAKSDEILERMKRFPEFKSKIHSHKRLGVFWDGKTRI